MPIIDDYYEPWTYDYENLITAPAGDTFPTAAPKSLISGKPMKVSWGPNWDDNLAGSPEILAGDPILKKVSEEVKLSLEETFMFYLPRICEHCLNPSCVASCPSGAMYKRSEDGIVLVDQDRCRGWRMCVSGCPYKKVYFNHKTGKAEKCTLCYPRMEVGLPTICSETCVGRLRYLGVVLYDVDRVLEAASVENDTDLYEAQCRILLDPCDPEVITAARAEGISDEWIEAAQRSPVYALIHTYKVALPLHPEYRTMPMVWYIPPLSPVVDAVSRDGHDGEELGQPVRRAGGVAYPDAIPGRTVHRRATPAWSKGVLRRLAAMRSYMRDINLGRDTQPHIPHSVGMTEEEIYEMYRLLAIAKYEERYVIPTAFSPQARDLEQMGCSLYGRGWAGHVRVVVPAGMPVPVWWRRSTARRRSHHGKPSRVNLLNWDGRKVPAGMFPEEQKQ